VVGVDDDVVVALGRLASDPWNFWIRRFKARVERVVDLQIDKFNIYQIV